MARQLILPLISRRRRARGLDQFRGVLTLSASIDLELLRASMLLEKDPAAAARQAGAILANYPGHDVASLLFAAARRRLGDSADAVQVIESMALMHATSALIRLELG